jgi:hypothetical protein
MLSPVCSPLSTGQNSSVAAERLVPNPPQCPNPRGCAGAQIAYMLDTLPPGIPHDRFCGGATGRSAESIKAIKAVARPFYRLTCPGNESTVST